MFELEWPPHSGRRQKFPEIDRAAWFSVPQAVQKILLGQRPAITELVTSVGLHSEPSTPAGAKADLLKPGCRWR
jgi:predicted NUDIX family NTP pyrophosphohydrolase